MKEQQDGTPYEGRYAGSAITFANRRTTATPPERSTRNRYVAPPAPTHRQGHYSGIHPSDDNCNSDSFGIEEDGGDYQEEPARSRSSAVRYPVPPRRETTNLQPKPTKVINRRFDRTSLVIWLCLGLIVMIVGWWFLSWVSSWWQGVTDNWQYGMPRTFQTDHYVNQGDSPEHPDHFLALNVRGQVEVIQLNPQNPQLDHIYGITTTDDPSNPVTLSFPNDDGKQYLYVSIGDRNPYTVRLVSDGKEFIAPGQH